MRIMSVIRFIAKARTTRANQSSAFRTEVIFVAVDIFFA